MNDRIIIINNSLLMAVIKDETYNFIDVVYYYSLKFRNNVECTYIDMFDQVNAVVKLDNCSFFHRTALKNIKYEPSFYREKILKEILDS